jgi:protein-S-isoprenylcysteine O-methyltransferase Ste14
MRPLIFAWPYAAAFWPLFFWVMLPEFRLRQAARRLPMGQDGGSMRVILAGGQLGMIAAIVLAFKLPSASMPAPALGLGLGMACLLAGGVLRRHCFRMLGEFFTGDVNARAGQPVIDRGAYRWIRHPSYTAGMLLFTGIGVALGNWLSMIVMAGTMALVYAYRVNVEEQTLLKTLGEPYRKFMQTRKRFIPYLF